MQKIERMFQVAVNKNDFAVFNKKMQELNLVPVDYQPVRTSMQNDKTKVFWITFSFVPKHNFLVKRPEIMVTDLVSKVVRIN